MESAQKEDGVVIDNRLSRLRQVFGFGTLLAVSCLLSYWLITTILAREYFASKDNDLVGGMWAVVATIFVFRHSILESARAALSRTVATLLSFALCFLYLLIFPFHVLGMVALIWTSTVILALIGRSEDIITAGITTAVVLVVAGVSHGPGWLQPLLRLVDTAVGIAVGILTSRIAPALDLVQEQ